jgi:predicted nucleotidyltransferase
VVFGSTVTGTVDEESDLDLAVIVPDPEPGEKFNRVDRAVELRRQIRDINAQIAIDILVYTESEFSKLRNSPSFLRGEIAEAGATVYERAG